MDRWGLPGGVSPAVMSTSEVGDLLEIAGSEGETVRQLERCVAQLVCIREAKATLARLSPIELRTALRCRRYASSPPGGLDEE